MSGRSNIRVAHRLRLRRLRGVHAPKSHRAKCGHNRDARRQLQPITARFAIGDRGKGAAARKVDDFRADAFLGQFIGGAEREILVRPDFGKLRLPQPLMRGVMIDEKVL